MTFQKVEKVLEIPSKQEKDETGGGQEERSGPGAARVLGAGMLVCTHGARRRHGVQSSVRCCCWGAAETRTVIVIIQGWSDK